MKVLLLIRSFSSPSARYRILQYLPAIQSSGIEVCVECLPSGWLARRRLFRRAAEFDVVVLQKRLLPVHMVRALRRHAKRLIYDFDDAVLFRSPGKGGAESATRRRRFRAIISAADVVLAGNSYLSQIAAPFAKRIIVLPTVIDPEKYDRAASVVTQDSETVTIGWIGSRTTMRYLLSIRDALDQLTSRVGNIRLKIVSNSFMDLQKMPVLKKPWHSEDEAADVAGFDIGIAPSFDDPWSMGKCGFKILQYMACSVPVICTPVGVQSEMVADGENGYWATTFEEWIERLSRLAESPEERRRMGRAGRTLLDERYSLAKWAPRFAALLAGTNPAHAE